MKLIGIMVLTKKFRKQFLEYFLPYNNFSDVTLFAFTPHSINWQKKRIKGVYKQNGVWKTKLFSFPNCVINQTYTTSIQTVKKLEKAIGPDKVFNRVNRLSKWKTYEVIAKSKLKKFTPVTWWLEEVDLPALLEEKHSLFLKPEFGTLGEGVYKLTKDETGFHILQNQTKPKFSFENHEDLMGKLNEITAGKNYLVQEEVKPKRVNGNEFFEVRIILQKGLEGKWCVTAALSRRVTKSNILANLAFKVEHLVESIATLEWLKWKKRRLIKKMKRLALQTAAELEREYGLMGEQCVDMMLTESGEIKILEVNGRPSKKMIQRLQDEQLEKLFFSNPIKYAYMLART